MFGSVLPRHGTLHNAPMRVAKVAGSGWSSFLAYSTKRFLGGSKAAQHLNIRSYSQSRHFHRGTKYLNSQGQTLKLRTDEVQFFHFNDVYHIPSSELLSRFLDTKTHFAASNANGSTQTLTLFSGDVFSPSLEASVLKGEQALPLLNLLGIDVACYGNHDFDFGEARLIELSGQLKFPWLLSNAYHRPVIGQKRLLASAQEYLVRDLENGLRVGFIGLAGTDWPSNCELLPPCEIEPPVEAARRLARHLRVDKGCDLVIALTHMRLPEDMAVAAATIDGDSRIDMLFGGHDHTVLRRFAGDTDTNAQNLEPRRNVGGAKSPERMSDARGDIRLVKSGTDWRGLSLVKLYVHRDEQGAVTGTSVQLHQWADIEHSTPTPRPKPEIIQTLKGIGNRVEIIVQKPFLRSAVPLDGRNSTVRSQETNMGNMLADVLRAFYDTDIGFFNSGGIRSDKVLPATAAHGGDPLLVRDIINICPFGGSLFVKRLSGEIIRLALENAVSDKHTDGRFLQISGLRIVANWQKPEGSRVVDVQVEGAGGSLEPLDPSRTYTVAMPSFIANGYDGFVWFPGQETVVGEEAAMTDSGLLLAVFGHGGESGGDAKDSAHTLGIERARARVIVGHDLPDSLPIVKPEVEGRVRFVE